MAASRNIWDVASEEVALGESDGNSFDKNVLLIGGKSSVGNGL